jgi:hypothetical protein
MPLPDPLKKQDGAFDCDRRSFRGCCSGKPPPSALSTMRFLLLAGVSTAPGWSACRC